MIRKLLSPGRKTSWEEARVRQDWSTAFLYGALSLVILLFSNLIIGKTGVSFFTIFLALALFGFLYTYMSFRSLMLPFSIAILSVGGFRFLWSVNMPGLPDLYVDRIAMIWLVVVFGVKSVAERKALRGPFLLDILMLANLMYLAMSLFVNEFTHFSLWTRSYLVPYAAYFMAKNIVNNQRYMRVLLIVLAVLNVYYAVTSVAEKFMITQLIWPKSILHIVTMWGGRSNGPFSHAPLFGTVQGMILPVYLYFIATTKSLSVRIINYAALILGFAGLYFTYTRGSWLAGLAALLVAIVLNRRQYVKISIPALALVPLVAIFVLGAGNDEMMKDRVDDDQTITARLGTAVTAIRMWRENPIFGVGFFQYRHVREHYVDPVEIPVFGTIRFANFRHTSIHDIYLGPLAETGLVGAFLQIAIYLVIFRAFLRHYRNRDGSPHFRVYIMPIMGGLCVGYLVGGTAIDYRFFSMVGTMFYSVAGIVYGYDGRTAIAAETNVESDGRSIDDEA